MCPPRHARAIIARVPNVIRVFFGFDFLGAKAFVCLFVLKTSLFHPIAMYSIQKTEGKAFQSLPLPQAFVVFFFLSARDDWEGGSEQGASGRW